MTHPFKLACSAVLAAAVLPTLVLAQGHGGANLRTQFTPSASRPAGAPGGSSGGVPGAPEIDPALAIGGLALLAGGTLILLGRKREATA